MKGILIGADWQQHGRKVKEVEVRENYAHTVLKDAEAVLMKRISRMREGKPRTAAQAKLGEIRKAFLVLSNKQND